MKEPTTPAEWQDAVTAAHACMMLYSAREEHGIVEGGPGVKVERCLELLERGRALGYEPDDSAVEDFIQAFKSEHPDLQPTFHYERVEAVRKFAGRPMR